MLVLQKMFIERKNIGRLENQEKGIEVKFIKINKQLMFEVEKVIEVRC